MKTLNMSHVWWDMLKTKVVIYSLRNGLSLGINGFIRKCILSGCKIATLARGLLFGTVLFFNVTFCIGMQTSLFPLTNVWTPWTRYRLLHHIGLLSSSGYYHSRYHEMTQNRWKHNLLPASQGNVQLSSVVWEQHYHRISQTLEE